jgi:DNA polymerase alpha subunit B
MDLPPLQLFQQEVGRKISSFLDYSLNTTAVLIPSVRDMVSQHIAYPQSPLERDVLQLHKVSTFVCQAENTLG